MAVASAGPFANNLHLTPDWLPHQHPPHHSIFTGWVHFLMPNQQCQSTEGNNQWVKLKLIHRNFYATFICIIHPFNGPFSGITQVSRYQKGKTNLDFTEARESEWQLHQLGHMQVCTSLQTDNYASTPPLSFFTGRMPFLPPNQQRQSTEGTSTESTSTEGTCIICIIIHYKNNKQVSCCYMLLFIISHYVHLKKFE